MNTDERNELKKKTKKTVIAATAGASLMVGSLYDSPEELLANSETDERNKAVVFEHEQRQATAPTVKERIQDWIGRLPLIVRALVGIPLWLIGSLLTFLLDTVWSQLLVPNAARLVTYLVIFLVIIAVALTVGKMLFPKKKLRELYDNKILLISLITVILLSIVNYILPKYWDDYKDYLKLFESLLMFGGILASVLFIFNKNITHYLVVTHEDTVLETETTN